MTWLTRCAAVVLNRRMVESDRKTAQERIKERRSLRSMCEFGERVMFRIPRARKLGEPAERQGNQECGLAWRKLLLGPRKINHHVAHSQENANKRKMELGVASQMSGTSWRP